MLFFDYPGAEESCEKTTNQMLARSAGEEMKAEYSGTEIEQLVKDCGFEVCDHWNGDGMTARYFVEYNRLNPEHPLKVPDGTGYLCAVRR